MDLADGDVLHLHVGAVAKRLGDGTVRMLDYNGSIPGPTIKVRPTATTPPRCCGMTPTCSPSRH
jgi:hypothetical protein